MSKLSHTTKPDRKIYGNCQVLSPDNILMFRCDNKKIHWYLNRNLATIISESPFIIRLNFHPNGLGNHNKDYGLTKMENVCVNCGTEKYLTRHHVVPYCYRRFFPVNLKAHNFHDVLSMCADCHEFYEIKAFDLKKEIASKHNVPLNGIINKADESFVKALKYSKAILLNDRIPEKRLMEMMDCVRSYFGCDFTTEDLEKLSQTSYQTICKTHGEIIISSMNENEILEFIKMWRKHFVDNNDCLFLPENWDIENEW